MRLWGQDETRRKQHQATEPKAAGVFGPTLGGARMASYSLYVTRDVPRSGTPAAMTSSPGAPAGPTGWAKTESGQGTGLLVGALSWLGRREKKLHQGWPGQLGRRDPQ